METWVPFVVWISIIVLIIPLCRLLCAMEFFGAITIALLLASSVLVMLHPLSSPSCNYTVSIEDTIIGSIFLFTGSVMVVYTLYNALKDNKKHLLCICCRKTPDIAEPIGYYDAVYNEDE